MTSLDEDTLTDLLTVVPDCTAAQPSFPVKKVKLCYIQLCLGLVDKSSFHTLLGRNKIKTVPYTIRLPCRIIYVFAKHM